MFILIPGVVIVAVLTPRMISYIYLQGDRRSKSRRFIYFLVRTLSHFILLIATLAGVAIEGIQIMGGKL